MSELEEDVVDDQESLVDGGKSVSDGLFVCRHVVQDLNVGWCDGSCVSFKASIKGMSRLRSDVQFVCVMMIFFVSYFIYLAKRVVRMIDAGSSERQDESIAMPSDDRFIRRQNGHFNGSLRLFASLLVLVGSYENSMSTAV